MNSLGIRQGETSQWNDNGTFRSSRVWLSSIRDATYYEGTGRVWKYEGLAIC